ncbi:MAG: DegT/DnrJ/EryC1/StrS aminotransferase family protein [Hyphomicrobiaceae bacterium]|nr:DegT/DnrJ/EryC1/StrS aminotransferase family protein [Hyphomicrobiaceae bacterium]
MIHSPFAPWPSFTEDEIAAVSRVLASNRVNYWTGEECRRFEEEFAAWTGAKHAIALANGTVALDLALYGLDIGPGDEVIVPPRTFIASVSCVVNAGATPVFADVDRNSGNITAATIEAAITHRTRAIIAVHLAGWPCCMDAILDLARQYDLTVIEDCAQAHGARCQGRSVGTFGHVAAWSFCQDKIMTTGGEGGMVTTNDPALWDRMWAFKDHGKSFDAVYNRPHPPGYRWLHESFGTNWRMLEMQAAIGRIQLTRMPEWTARRTSHSHRITDALRPFAGPGGPVRLPEPLCGWTGSAAGGCVHARYKYYAYVEPSGLADGWTRDRIVAEFNAAGVPCFTGSCSEVYLERAFDGTPWRPAERLPIARELGETSIMFLVHPTLCDDDIELTVRVIGDVMAAARR